MTEVEKINYLNKHMPAIQFRALRTDMETPMFVYGLLTTDIYDRWWIHVDYVLDGIRYIKKIQVKRHTVQRYIGLKDMNGKPIFEGDIVKWGHTPGWGEENPVRYANVAMNPDIVFYSQVGPFPYGNFAYKETSKYLEVIGNLYETPELLTKTEQR